MPAASQKTLKTTGVRVTKQRSLIMQIIRQGHLDADEIYRRARSRRPRLSLSTVYRTLQVLKKVGLVEELHFDETHHHYEVTPSDEHHHLLCLGCGRVIEFRQPLTRYLKRNVAEAQDFDIVETEVRVTGYCAECHRKRK